MSNICNSTYEMVEKYKKTKAKCDEIKLILKRLFDCFTMKDKSKLDVIRIEYTKYPISSIETVDLLYLKYNDSYVVMHKVLPYILSAINEKFPEILSSAYKIAHNELLEAGKNASKEVKEILSTINNINCEL